MKSHMEDICMIHKFLIILHEFNDSYIAHIQIDYIKYLLIKQLEYFDLKIIYIVFMTTSKGTCTLRIHILYSISFAIAFIQLHFLVKF